MRAWAPSMRRPRATALSAAGFVSDFRTDATSNSSFGSGACARTSDEASMATLNAQMIFMLPLDGRFPVKIDRLRSLYDQLAARGADVAAAALADGHDEAALGHNLRELIDRAV